MKLEMNSVKMNGLIVEDSAAQTSANSVAESAVESKPEQVNGLIAAEPMDSAGTEVATTSDTNTDIVAGGQGNAPLNTIDNDVDESDIGYGAFPKLKIENGEFDIAGQSAGKKIIVSVMSRYTQRLIKPADTANPTKEQMAYYQVVKGVNSDTLTTTKGILVKDFKNSLKEEGLRPEESEYEMVQAQIIKLSKEVGEVVPTGTMAEMQIPSASMQRFRGIMLGLKHKNIPLGERAIVVSVGAKVQSDKGTYNPWVIEPMTGTTTQVCEKLGIDLETSGGVSLDSLEDF